MAARSESEQLELVNHAVEPLLQLDDGNATAGRCRARRACPRSGGRRPSAGPIGRWWSSPARPVPRHAQEPRTGELLPIAAPIALSSWNTTSDEDPSRGSTVLRLTINRQEFHYARALLGDLRGRPEVDPEVVGVVGVPPAEVAEGLLVLGRGSGRSPGAPNRPSERRRARWPPLRSASDPTTTSIRNGSRPSQVGGDPRLDPRAEVVDVGDHRVPEARVEQRRQHARAPERAVHVAMPRAATTPFPAPQATEAGWSEFSASSFGTMLCMNRPRDVGVQLRVAFTSAFLGLGASRHAVIGTSGSGSIVSAEPTSGRR